MEDQPTPKTSETPLSNTSTPSDRFYKSSRFWLAVVLIGIYLGFVIYLMKRADLFELGEDTIKNASDNLKWTRFLFLFTGIEAIVFTAVGYVFGRNVSRRTEQKAEYSAEQEKNERKKADAAKQKAQKEAEKHKANLIRLQESVLGEYYQNQSKVTDSKSQKSADNVAKSKLINNQGAQFYTRSFELAKALDINNSLTSVRFEYEIKASGFQKVIIDGQPLYTAKGRVFNVYEKPDGISITVDWDGTDEWEFEAKEIRNEETGNQMEMTPKPLKSKNNTDSFYVK